MSTFKKGDRVEVTVDDANGAVVKESDRGTIVSVGYEIYDVQMDRDMYGRSTMQWMIQEKYLWRIED